MARRNAVSDFLSEAVIAFRILPARRGDLIAAMNANGFDKRGFGSGDFIATRLPKADVEPLSYAKLSAALAAMRADDMDALDAALA